MIVANTFSKNWAMTGWRAGWLIYPRGLDATFAKLGQYNTTSIPTFVQHAAVTALDEGDGFIRTMVGRCAEARAILIEGLSRLPGAAISPPEGAFYLMARSGRTSRAWIWPSGCSTKPRSVSRRAPPSAPRARASCGSATRSVPTSPGRR